MNLDLQIVLAIAGSIALLIGLFGGGVKAKEIEIPKIRVWPRILSGMVGVALIGTAIRLPSMAPAPEQPTTMLPPVEAPTPTEVPTDTPTDTPSNTPTNTPTDTLTATPTDRPTAKSTPVPIILIIRADNDYWFDTGIDVKPGQTIEISVSGEINFHGGTPEAASGPNGNDAFPCFFENCPGKDLPAGLVLGRVGNETFQIGAGIRTTVASGGRLYLIVNDTHWRDNIGNFLVEIILQ
jgi:hypothetical protein